MKNNKGVKIAALVVALSMMMLWGCGQEKSKETAKTGTEEKAETTEGSEETGAEIEEETISVETNAATVTVEP